MTKRPLISVVLPVYNARKWVDAAVYSILQQTFRDFELIIVDDGSTDGTSAVLARWARRDRRIKLISRPNTGVVGACNDGLNAAQGEYIARMDADDVSLPQRFERQVAYLKQHPECTALGTAVRMIDTDGDPVRDYFTPCGHEEIDRLLFRSWAIFHPTLMAPRRAIMAVGGYRPEFATLEDLDLLLRLGEMGRLANLAEPLVEYRVHLKSMSNTRTAHMNSIVDEVLRQACERRGTPLPEDAVPEVGPDENDPFVLEMMWAWWAHDDGYFGTARKHAMRLLRRHPLNAECWRLLYCAMRGLRRAA